MKRNQSRSVIGLAAITTLALAACGGGSDSVNKSDTASGGSATTSSSSAPAPEESATTAPEESSMSETASASASPDPGSGDAAAMSTDKLAVDIDAMLAADLNKCEPKPTGDPIKVGMAMDFSEVVGFVDIPGSKLDPYVAELINCIGGVDGHPIEVKVESVNGTADGASAATASLLDWGAQILIGPPFADFALPISQESKGEVPLFVAASTEPTLADAEHNSYLVSFDDTEQATAAAKYALAQGHKTAFVFTQPGPYSGYNPDVFTKVFEEGGGKVVATETYVWGSDTDFSAQVSSLSKVLKGDEVFYSAMLAPQVTALKGQLEGAGFKDITYMGTDAPSATGIELDPAAEGVIHTPHTFISPGDQIDTLLKRYADDNGGPLDEPTFMGLYVDSMLLGLQGAHDCGCTDPVKIGEAVREIEGFPGLTGTITYKGTNGIPPKKVNIVVVENGADKLLERM